MALPSFAGFSLQDDNYITSQVNYRTWPTRDTSTKKTARKPGSKFIAEEFGEKRISLMGYIIGSSVSDLKNKIDDFNASLQKNSDILEVESGRYFTATAASVAIGDPRYSQDFVPFEVEFICADPFAYGDPLSATMTVTSGTVSQTLSTTISGSYFAEPEIKYTAPAGSGLTTTSGINITYRQSGEYVDWDGNTSGTGDTYIDRGEAMTFDYKNYKILQGTTQVEHTGVFAQCKRGTANFDVIFGGTPLGGTLEISYVPRYL